LSGHRLSTVNEEFNFGFGILWRACHTCTLCWAWKSTDNLDSEVWPEGWVGRPRLAPAAFELT
jgi:hypothetical protein